MDQDIYSSCKFPWIKRNSNYSSNTLIHLHQEILDFFEYMSPTAEEQHARRSSLERITLVVLDLWPLAEVHLYGSYKNGLSLPWSDLDIVVLGSWTDLPLRPLSDALLQNGICDNQNILILDKAVVPIIKLTDKVTKIKIDISFNCNSGIKSAELVVNLKLKFPALAKLVLVLKQFLRQSNLNEVYYGGLSSYSLVLMAFYFLQHKSKANHATNVNHENLGILLIDFFKFYSKDFNYKMKTICITDGGSDINQLDPVTNCAIFPKSSISIEDPLCPGNDISRGSYRYQQVISEFGNAYASLTEVVNPMSTISASSSKKSVLGRILEMKISEVNLRKWTGQQFK